MRGLASLLVSLSFLCIACEKPGAEAARPCRKSSDCDDGWVCLARVCADPRGSAIYTDPAHAVTPDKVRDEVEQAGERRAEDLEDRIERAAEER
jgi:hypothetical protein